MLMLPADVQIYMLVEPVDLRRSFDGLSAIIMERLQMNPLSGHLFLFRGRGGDRIKALFWGRNGMVIWYKRLKRGVINGHLCKALLSK